MRRKPLPRETDEEVAAQQRAEWVREQRDRARRDEMAERARERRELVDELSMVSGVMSFRPGVPQQSPRQQQQPPHRPRPPPGGRGNFPPGPPGGRGSFPPPVPAAARRSPPGAPTASGAGALTDPTRSPVDTARLLGTPVLDRAPPAGQSGGGSGDEPPLTPRPPPDIAVAPIGLDPGRPPLPVQRALQHRAPAPPVGDPKSLKRTSFEIPVGAEDLPPGVLRRVPAPPKGTPWAGPLPQLLQTFRGGRDKERERWVGGSYAVAPTPRPEFKAVQRYVPAAERAAAAEAEQLAQHVAQPRYDGAGSNTRNAGMPVDLGSYDYRRREPAADIHPRPMRYGARTQRERLDEELACAPKLHGPPAPLPPHFLMLGDDHASPRAACLNRARWVAGGDFRRYHTTGGGKAPPWTVPAPRAPSPYVDKVHHSSPLFGLRHRDTSREMTVAKGSAAEQRRGFELGSTKDAGYFQPPVLDPL